MHRPRSTDPKTHVLPTSSRSGNLSAVPSTRALSGPGAIDKTFGPDVKFVSVPANMKQNRPPSDGLQFFGIGRIDARTRALTVSLHGMEGQTPFKVELPAEV